MSRKTSNYKRVHKGFGYDVRNEGGGIILDYFVSYDLVIAISRIEMSTLFYFYFLTQVRYIYRMDSTTVSFFGKIICKSVYPPITTRSQIYITTEARTRISSLVLEISDGGVNLPCNCLATLDRSR